jgi:glycosyltransferase involved in cell wall biosynthesis
LAQLTAIPRKQIQAIYNPVVRPALKDLVKAPVKHPWFRPGEPPVILAVGRLTVQKDFPTLIRAFAQVRRAHVARLVILGDGEERAAIEALTQELGVARDVSLPGFARNPYAYMARAGLFVLSSRWEGLPGVLIEALYCGVPVISTDCPSGPREILKNGQYGLLVPVGNVDKLASAMDTALAHKLPRASRESCQPFELDTVVNQYLNLLLQN